jgi:hypothetical protein
MNASLQSEDGQTAPQVGNADLCLSAKDGGAPGLNKQKRRAVWKAIFRALSKFGKQGRRFIVLAIHHQLICPLKHRRNILFAPAKPTLSSPTEHI